MFYMISAAYLIFIILGAFSLAAGAPTASENRAIRSN
jgi:hypothetical protein